LTKHGGETLDAPAMWQQHFQAHQVHQREIEQSPPVSRSRPRTVGGVSID